MGELPKWATEMKEIFKGGSISQFILHGNVNDWVPAPNSAGGTEFFSLKDFLVNIMFEPFEVVIGYNRGKGIWPLKGGEHFFQFLKVFDTFHNTRFSTVPTSSASDPLKPLDYGNLLPKEPKRALELIDRFIRNGLYRTRTNSDQKVVSAPMRIAVILDYAHYLFPRVEPAYMNQDSVEVLIKVLEWASDRIISSAFIATCLITENLADLNKQIVESLYSSKLRIDLPDGFEVHDYVESITATIPDFSNICEIDRQSLGQKLEGLSRVDIHDLIQRAVKNNRKISQSYLKKIKKEMIETAAGGRIEFVESKRNLDDVAGHYEAKSWLRQDAKLIKKGRLKALPMGYLFNGRIGTGKTFLVECFAGEAGIPCVELKNFREKWVGASEGNLESIFKILHAMGQVIVFVDEADQMAGKRGGGDGDSGLSGRIYGMLAREMSDTQNRGRILWIFATSRPDLLEVDLKRIGRLDVHIPLFSPQSKEGKKELFLALAKKNKIELNPEDVPVFPDDMDIGGNEMEGILIRASRLFESQDEPESNVEFSSPPAQNKKNEPQEKEKIESGEAKETIELKPIRKFIQESFQSYKPMAHAEKLEYMDLIAVIECTDERFLPEKYAKLDMGKVKQRVEELKHKLGE